MPPLIVNVTQGDLEGCARKTQSGFEYNSYQGIPYAKAPVGELRFKDPVPHEGWSGVRQATIEGEKCLQIDRLFAMQMIGDEDGLFLNVYTPANANEGYNLPVMVWIHGGAYVTGSGDSIIYGPDYIVEKNVILVTLNYRLGALGFLCLNTPEVPGNAGLKDQMLALRWVQRNIGRFGGDRDNVTLFGESAGSFSVHLHVLSETSNGLFQRAIMQSGASISSRIVQTDPEDAVVALAKNLGFDGDDKHELFKFLQSVPAGEIVKQVDANFKLSDRLNFMPVVEKIHSGVEAFITASPMQLILAGKFNKVPIIKGFNSHEGLFFAGKSQFGDTDIATLNKVEDFIPDLSRLLPEKIREQGSDVVNSVVDKIKKFYFKEGRLIVDGFADLMSDISFILDIDTSVRLMRAHTSPIYYYKFSYSGGLNFVKPLINYVYKGAAHADELGYIFKADIQKLLQKTNNENMKVEINPADILTLKRMVEMWTNFAKVGDPTMRLTDAVTTKWLPVTNDQLNCLDIDADLSMILNPYAERINFWMQLRNAEQ